jgi:hypothetical protein
MKNKILIFVVGLFAGLIVGVLFSVAIKELLSQFKELHISLNKITLRQSQLSQRLDSIQGKLVPDTKKTPGQAQNNPKPSTPNSSKSSALQSNVNPPVSDNTDETANTDDDDSDVVVMTNQLVSVLSVPLKKSDTNKIDKKNTKTDSTLAAMSDVSNSREISNYRIEFWKSPLNYKGYKMSAGKIVLYGINPVTAVNLIMEEDSYYLLVNQNAFKLEFTDDYKPFERVTEKTLLKKLGYED